MTDNDRHLDMLFAQYRAACPDPEPTADFMPRLWARIEGPPSFGLVFRRLGRLLLTGAGATCLLFVGLNMMPRPVVPITRTGYATYTDALSADNTLERTYYSAESTPPANSVPPDYEQ